MGESRALCAVPAGAGRAGSLRPGLHSTVRVPTAPPWVPGGFPPTPAAGRGGGSSSGVVSELWSVIPRQLLFRALRPFPPAPPRTVQFQVVPHVHPCFTPFSATRTASHTHVTHHTHTGHNMPHAPGSGHTTAPQHCPQADLPPAPRRLAGRAPQRQRSPPVQRLQFRGLQPGPGAPAAGPAQDRGPPHRAGNRGARSAGVIECVTRAACCAAAGSTVSPRGRLHPGESSREPRRAAPSVGAISLS